MLPLLSGHPVLTSGLLDYAPLTPQGGPYVQTEPLPPEVWRGLCQLSAPAALRSDTGEMIGDVNMALLHPNPSLSIV